MGAAHSRSVEAGGAGLRCHDSAMLSASFAAAGSCWSAPVIWRSSSATRCRSMLRPRRFTNFAPVPLPSLRLRSIQPVAWSSAAHAVPPLKRVDDGSQSNGGQGTYATKRTNREAQMPSPCLAYLNFNVWAADFSLPPRLSHPSLSPAYLPTPIPIPAAKPSPAKEHTAAQGEEEQGRGR